MANYNSNYTGQEIDQAILNNRLVFPNPSKLDPYAEGPNIPFTEADIDFSSLVAGSGQTDYYLKLVAVESSYDGEMSYQYKWITEDRLAADIAATIKSHNYLN